MWGGDTCSTKYGRSRGPKRDLLYGPPKARRMVLPIGGPNANEMESIGLVSAEETTLLQKSLNLAPYLLARTLEALGGR